MKRPKILLALFRMPYPITDGTRYKLLNNVASGLKELYDIEFFIVTIRPIPTEDLRYLEETYGRVHVFYHSVLSFVCNSISVLWKWIPFQSAAYYFRDARKWFEAHADAYDGVYTHEIRMTEYAIRLPEKQKKKILVDFNDAISLSYKASLKHLSGVSGFLKKIFYSVEGNLVSRYETKVLRSFTHFNIVSIRDRQYLLAKATGVSQSITFSAIRHGVALPKRGAPLDEANLFFMGNLDYAPNRDALVFFLEHIWPRVKVRLPKLEFFIIGRGKSLEVADDRVHHLGFVSDIFSILSKCGLLVAPIRFGGGAPSKIIESMGYGLPVLTTDIGVAALEEKGGDAIYRASENDIDAWVSYIEKNTSDTTLRKEMGARARAYIQKYYSRETSEKAFQDEFRSIVS